MTLSEVSSLLPPPEGYYWFESDDGVCVLRETDERSLRVIIKDLSSDDRDRWSVAAENFEVEARIRLITTRADLPAAYLRALTAVGLAPDAEKEALQAEVFALRRTLRECPTCDGDGIMDAVAGVTAPDGEEIIENVTCAECQGTGVSSWGEALDEAERLRLEVAVLRRRLTWTSEVPTEAGDYLVRWTETRGRPVVWTFDAGVWYGPSGTVCRPPPLGSSFLSVADLKETR